MTTFLEYGIKTGSRAGKLTLTIQIICIVLITAIIVIIFIITIYFRYAKILELRVRLGRTKGRLFKVKSEPNFCAQPKYLNEDEIGFR